MKNLNGKMVLITGGSSGIGAETARFLGSKGAKVILLALNQDRLKNVAEEIEQHGGSAHYFSVDLSNGQQVETITEQIKRDIGIPDIIINNAGAGRWLTIEETSAQEAQAMMTVPYLAAFFVTKAFIREMKERGTGHIINLTSDASFLPKGAAIGYSAARYALRGFSEALRIYLVDTGIVVSLAVFGKVSSSYWENNPGSEERIPKPTPFMPTLTTKQVAGYLYQIILKKQAVLIKPSVFKFLFWLFRNWPDRVAVNMKASKT